MKNSAARQILITLTVLLTCVLPAMSVVVVPESVKEALDRGTASSSVELLITFENDIDLGAIKMDRLRRKLDRADNYRDVMERLSRNRNELKASILPHLESMKAEGKIESYKFFTVSKTVLVLTRIDNVDNLLSLPGVSLVNTNDAVSLINPVEEEDAPVFSKATLANSALDAINIRSLWDRGLNGNGGLICSFDTGIDGDHPALGAKWRGNNGGSAAESWFAPHGGTFPDDNIGHGSHVMGVMVGSTELDTIGVAPGAQWISAAVIDQGVSFSTTIADILSAFDWALNPDGDINTTDDLPDVICNSWGVPRGIYGDCDNTFWSAIDNVEAAGIVAIFAAGNEGPTPGSMRNPADRASTPFNSFSVGAVDPLSMVVADFSSRGPASCDGVSIKPELVAPGVGIYSSYKDGSYKIMSGTSMAAPFVAGLVTLMRQFNPEATVDEIKSALIQATIDLGPTGEDNAYGYGMIDASKILNYLPTPEMPSITVYNHHINSGDDGFADPGEMAELTFTLNEPTASVDSVDVQVFCNSDWVQPSSEMIRYRFAEGAAYAISLEPFHLEVSPDAISSGWVELMIKLRYLNGLVEDSVVYMMEIGHTLPGRMIEVEAGELGLTASDFGQFGFGPGSIYQAGGGGLTFAGSDNLLFEAGLIVGRNEQMVSDAIRDSDGEFKESDFAPSDKSDQFAANFDEDLTASYVDDNATLPLPIQVDQAIYHTGQNYAIVQFTVVNPTPSPVDHLALGLFCDLDLSGADDRVGFDSMIDMLYQYNEVLGLYVGLVGVSSNEFAYSAVQNGVDSKQGFNTAEKYAMINRSGLMFDGTEAGDWYTVVSRTAGQIGAFGKFKMAIVMAAGESLEQLRIAAQAGINEYDISLDVDDDMWAALPTTMELSQNYPNPFNPETTIRFALTSAQQATLTVYNVTGQKVRTLVQGTIQAGQQSVVWDGRDDSGNAVASGIYFYRLSTDEETQSRKMVFLK